MNGCVYIHINKTNGKTYVGQSRNIKARWRSKYRQQPYFNKALNKHGWSGFDHLVVVDGIDCQSELDNLEKLWITVLCSTDKSLGYNLVPGGFSGSFELGHMGGTAANKNPENRNRLKRLRTFESSSRGGQIGGKVNSDSGWSKELGTLQGNKNKESGHWDRVKILGFAFAEENGRQQGLRNAENGHLKRLDQGKKNAAKPGYMLSLGKLGGKIGGPLACHLRWHIKRNIVNPLCALCQIEN
jgi:group I intron endonuclease